jgi:integrase
MEHKRRRFQFGWLNLKVRRNGPAVWVLRYRETSQDGRMKTRSVFIGTIKEYPSESLARRRACPSCSR